MSGYTKLALIAVGALVALPEVSQAAPMTEPPFVTFFSQGGSGPGWRRNTGYLMTFVHWNQKGPEWNVQNIAWTEYWSGGGGALVLPPEGSQPGDPDWFDVNTPPWERRIIPEPSSALLVGGFVASLVLRRRVKA